MDAWKNIQIKKLGVDQCCQEIVFDLIENIVLMSRINTTSSRLTIRMWFCFMIKYQICTRCIMDTTDPEISFDTNGYCSHCTNFYDNIKDVYWLPNEQGRQILEQTISKIKTEGKGKEYDGIIGLSGGVDSSYLLHKICEWGIRPLAVHVDAGWNSETAVKNIEVLCNKLGVDLHTIVIDWESIKNLQVAFLKSGVKNQDIPQDHAFFAALYRYAVKNKIRYVIHGSNFATESILPQAWGYDAMDSIYIKAIFKQFGQGSIKNFPMVGFWELYLYYKFIKKMHVFMPLNLIPYKKKDAMKEIEDRYGWVYYGAKHWESRFTKFFQGYYLPTRFGYDKRKAHLSSLIVAGEITRDQALKEMEKPIYPANELDEDRNYIIKKLGLGEGEFEKLLHVSDSSQVLPTNESLKNHAVALKKRLTIKKRI
jgi:N-acetyl sugar amidotransferase